MQAFGLDRNTTINTINTDARNYLDMLLEKKRNGGQIPQYDFIYTDAFNDLSVPYQLVTKEFNDKIAQVLRSQSGKQHDFDQCLSQILEAVTTDSQNVAGTFFHPKGDG